VADLSEIMRSLGRLEEGQARMSADIEASNESRSRIHARLEKIEGDVLIVGHGIAQVRDKVDGLETVVVKDVKPVTDEIKKARLRGIGALWAVGIMATTFGFSAATAAENIITAIRAFLRIQ